VLALLEAGVPVTLLDDLFAAHGPDSAHIYRHEPPLDNTRWSDGGAAAVPVGAAGRPGGCWPAPRSRPRRGLTCGHAASPLGAGVSGTANDQENTTDNKINDTTSTTRQQDQEQHNEHNKINKTNNQTNIKNRRSRAGQRHTLASPLRAPE
jgi:hypothetical protein